MILAALRTPLVLSPSPPFRPLSRSLPTGPTTVSVAPVAPAADPEQSLTLTALSHSDLDFHRIRAAVGATSGAAGLPDENVANRVLVSRPPAGGLLPLEDPECFSGSSPTSAQPTTLIEDRSVQLSRSGRLRLSNGRSFLVSAEVHRDLRVVEFHVKIIALPGSDAFGSNVSARSRRQIAGSQSGALWAFGPRRSTPRP